MKNVLIIMKRELKSYFTSPIAYVVLTTFLVLTGAFFSLYLDHFEDYSAQYPYLSQQRPDLPVPNINERVFTPICGDIGVILLFVLPLVTMRVLSEEKRSGSIELLLSYPVKDSEVILGKYLSTCAVLFAMLLPTLFYPFLISLMGKLNWTMILVNYLGLFLVGASYLAIGIFFSSLTENQIIASITTFTALLFLWLLNGFQNLTGEKFGKVFEYLSVLTHQEIFNRAVIDSNDIVYFISFIFLFLFLTLRTLESNKWRA